MDGDSSTTDASQLGITGEYMASGHYVLQPDGKRWLGEDGCLERLQSMNLLRLETSGLAVCILYCMMKNLCLHNNGTQSSCIHVNYPTTLFMQLHTLAHTAESQCSGC